MQSEEKILTLLSEIREIQAKHLAEYSRIAKEALSIQRDSAAEQKKAIAQQMQSVEVQRKYVRLYKFGLLACTPIFIFFVWQLLKTLN
jgi:hypothetical protein